MSSFILDQIVAKSGGYSRPNRFMMNFVTPQSLEVSQFDILRTSVNCNASGLPGRSFGTSERSYGNLPVRKMPHSVIIEDLTTTFYLSRDNLEKRIFDAWQDLIYNPFTGALGYYDDYVSELSLMKLNQDVNDSFSDEYVFHEAYPISVATSDLNYRSNDELAQLQVTWSYREWSYKKLN